MSEENASALLVILSANQTTRALSNAPLMTAAVDDAVLVLAPQLLDEREMSAMSQVIEEMRK